ncbi:MAG: hypothetical protein RJQ10_00205 [Haliea sp.]|uniref:hypothetical protein n=1 Tax=Haliea sp. TaxID=1932666 RepID=UPI0032ED55EC
MPYVKRDSSGRIVAVSQLRGDCDEAVAPEDADLAAYLNALGHHPGELVATDQDFVRVLEDVVELLIERGIILFTDLPDSAQKKMLHRQRLRSKLSTSLDLLGDD